MINLKNKKGFEFSFGWLFSIIVGAVIIFLAIYFAMNIVSTGRNSQDTVAGSALGVILTPIETSLEGINKPEPIVFPVRTRVYNYCYGSGNFGEQKIAIATQSGLGKKWENPGVPSTYYNKYIFSKSTVEGSKANVIAKPFAYPYKVGDVIYLWSADDKYCFVSAPKDIESELGDLNIKGLNFTSTLAECAKNSTTICFSSFSGCDVIVSTIANTVSKDGVTEMYPKDNNALLYGAIFADPGIYECQAKRLMKRTGELAFLYKSKSELLASKGCGSNLQDDLLVYSSATLQFNSSASFSQTDVQMEGIDGKNKYLACKVY
ncbi:MAG: hypothetical protein WCK29_00680 [archaeon]